MELDQHRLGRMADLHRAYLDNGVTPLVPVVVLAQAWRNGRTQANLAHALNGCVKLEVTEEAGKAAGVLCGKAGTRDVVDALVVCMALMHGAKVILTSDHGDISHLVDIANAKGRIEVSRV